MTSPQPEAPATALDIPSPDGITPDTTAADTSTSETPPRPVRHHQLLRTSDGKHWGRLLVSVFVAAGVLLVLMTAVTTVDVAAEGDLGVDPAALDDLTTPWGLLTANLAAGAMIVVAALATKAGYGPNPMRIASVTGRLRLGWLLRSLAAATVGLALGYTILIGGTALVESLTSTGVDLGTDVSADIGLAANWPTMLAVLVLTTPLQCAGEEFLTRGWMSQLVGSVIRGPVISAVLASGVSSTVFALMHDNAGAWMLADRFMVGLLLWLLVWHTGGLEAAIAVHTVWNLSVLATNLIDLGPEEAGAVVFSWLDFALSKLLLLTSVAAILLAARRYRPAAVREVGQPA